MKNSPLFLTLAALVATGNVNAKNFDGGGNGAGNGGDAVICPGKAPELLDYVEALSNDREVSAPASASFETGLKEWSERFQRVDAVRAGKYSAQESIFLKELATAQSKIAAGVTDPAEINRGLIEVRFTNDHLEDVPDSDNLTLPPGCSKIQLIVQKKRGISSPYGKERFPYTIHLPTWSKMSAGQLVLTVFHEMYFREFLERGARDSRAARYVNMSLALTTSTLVSYLDGLKASYQFTNSVKLPWKFTAMGSDFSATEWSAVRDRATYSIVKVDQGAIGIVLVDNESGGTFASVNLSKRYERSKVAYVPYFGTFDAIENELVRHFKIGNLKVALTDRGDAGKIDLGADDPFFGSKTAYLYDAKGTARYVRDANISHIRPVGLPRLEAVGIEFDALRNLKDSGTTDFAEDFLARFVRETIGK